MLSTLPKLADKAFVLGFFLPTLLFVVAVAGIYCDQLWAKTLLGAALKEDGWESLAYFVLAVWVLAVLLMMINRVQFQILDGNRWPISKMAFLRQREQKRFDDKYASYQQLHAEWERQGATFPGINEASRQLRKLLKQFPVDSNDRRPTRLGNAIRAFEIYSYRVYGVDSTPLWIHLSTVISAELQTALDDARAQVNCAVNVCFFAAIVACLAVVRLVWGFEWHALATTHDLHAAAAVYFNYTNGVSFMAVIAAVVICRLAYLFSIELAYDWGELVKAAFDCYLPDLAKKLGFELSETGTERVAFWRAVSEQAIYWLPLDPQRFKPPANDQPADHPPGLMDQFAKLLTSIIRDK
jgi:hypothetical protein